MFLFFLSTLPFCWIPVFVAGPRRSRGAEGGGRRRRRDDDDDRVGVSAKAFEDGVGSLRRRAGRISSPAGE